MDHKVDMPDKLLRSPNIDVQTMVGNETFKEGQSLCGALDRFYHQRNIVDAWTASGAPAGPSLLVDECKHNERFRERRSLLDS